MAEKKPNEDDFFKIVKDSLDKHIIDEYTDMVKHYLANRGGEPLPLKLVWDDLVDVLGFDVSSKTRYRDGKNKNGKVPTSKLDGQLEPYEPGFKELFRYVAAVDLAIEFPRGRILVNRAVSKLLTRIHRRLNAYRGPALTPEDVELLRFLRRLSASKLKVASPEALQQIRLSEHYNLMRPIEPARQHAPHLADLFAEWNGVFDLLCHAVNSPWWIN